VDGARLTSKVALAAGIRNDLAQEFRTTNLNETRSKA
jgi:hypothetical protein